MLRIGCRAGDGARSTRRGRHLAIVCAVALGSVGATAIAVADQVYNDLDGSIDVVAEQMPLTVDGADGSTTFLVTPQDAADEDHGCNFSGSGIDTLTADVMSSNTSVATVSADTLTFTGNGCGIGAALSIHPVAAGTSTITLRQGATNTTGGTYDFSAATFVVTVTGGSSNTPPAVSISGVAGGASYDKGSVPDAICNVTDDEDGPSTFAAHLATITGPYASDGIGSQQASCSYTDAGGLTAASSVTYLVGDPTAPEISAHLTPSIPDGDGGWYRTDVALGWTVEDPQSPNSLQRFGCVDLTVSSDQAATSYDCTATSAGGTTGPVSVSIKRDATPPTFDCGVRPTGWQSGNVTLNCTADDATSGLRGSAAFTLSTTVAAAAESSHASTGSQAVADNAGNSATAGAYSFMVDRKAPAVALTCPSGDIVKGSAAVAIWTATDGGAGVAGADHGSIALNTSTVGQRSATLPAASVQDVVGNASAASSCGYHVVYSWTGFFQPIDNGGVFNQVNAGRTIPAKFSLGGDQGLNILAAGSPSSSQVACPAGAPVDTVEETSTTAVSALKYDAAADQYIYNWKTLSSYAGTCRKFTLKLADDTTHEAYFKFVK